jgi:hypothetical protein
MTTNITSPSTQLRDHLSVFFPSASATAADDAVAQD